MTGCSNNKIIKLLLIPSEDEFIKQNPHISQVHIFFFTQSYGTITFYNFTRENIHVAMAMVLFMQMMRKYVS